MVKNEESVVNDAIQYWRGFEDALNWSKKFIKDSDKFDEQLSRAQEMIEIYRERLHILKRKKNERGNKRN